MRFLCPTCRRHIEVPEENVIRYEMKGLVRAECPRCGNRGLLRWEKEKEYGKEVKRRKEGMSQEILL